MHFILMCVLSVLIFGCGTSWTNIGSTGNLLPPTPGEKASGYGYIPLDGLAITQTLMDDTCTQWRAFTGVTEAETFTTISVVKTPADLFREAAGQDPFKPLLQTLPDISVRFAVASFDNSGGLTFGPAKITVKNKNYRAILDYVNVDAIPVTFWITAFKDNKPIKPSEATKKDADSYEAKDARAYEATIREEDKSKAKAVAARAKTDADYFEELSKAAARVASQIAQGPYPGYSELITIPVYVGIGMRIYADITAIEGGVALTSLGSLGVDAQANRIVGTLTVQTIGITGESIATSLPLPSKLDQSTIENGILAIGSTRAVVYRTGTEGIVTTARVIGLYSPIGSEPALINAIYSELSKQKPLWNRPCKALPVNLVRQREEQKAKEKEKLK